MFTTNTSAKLFQSVLSKKLKKVGITYNTWLSLYFINSNYAISQNQLAKLVGITGPSMVKIIEGLSEEGLVSLGQDSDDHRKKLIFLTDKGTQKYNKILEIVIEFQESITKGVGQKELDIVADVFDKMSKNARNELQWFVYPPVQFKDIKTGLF